MLRIEKVAIVLVVPLASLIGSPPPAVGALPGTIRGEVKDASGHSLPGVSCVLDGEGLSTQLHALTDQEGRYTFRNLPLGDYRLRFDLDGFDSQELKLRLTAELTALELDAVLELGEVFEEIVVTAEIPILDHTSSISSSIGGPSRRRPRFAPRTRPEPPKRQLHTESYAYIEDNAFRAVADHPLSTFAVDVDTASFSNLRRFLHQGELSPRDSIRIEELLNYFRYDYPRPQDDSPFTVNMDVHPAPWQPEHRLLRIGIQGREIAIDERPPSNLTFLIDVSGSMNDPRKLPLVQSSLQLLAGEMNIHDRIAIVVYAGAAGVVLPPTSGGSPTILNAIDQLEAGGSTNGGEGIELAYQLARQSFVEGGINRVILATDGDFNVGVSSSGELRRLIQGQARSGVFLTVLGFGIGNYKDSTLEQLADHGNGNYAYIDRRSEAHKVLVEQLSGTLMTIAKDVKVQLELNPLRVSAYRLIGYENRRLAAEDFADDAKDAGEIGAGHSVTALYELVPAGSGGVARRAGKLRYQRQRRTSAAASGDELLTVKLRYKLPEARRSRLIEQRLLDPGADGDEPSADFHLAAAVASFGMQLRESQHRGATDWRLVEELTGKAQGERPDNYRRELLELVRLAQEVAVADSASTP